MRVLMFGWEFPPHITGGLGTACFGMTKGLAKNNVEVLFVVPRAYGDEDQSRRLAPTSSRMSVRKSSRSLWKTAMWWKTSTAQLQYLRVTTSFRANMV